MRTSKKIKKAYEKLPVPGKEDVLPVSALKEPKKVRRFTPRLAYSLASLVLVAAIVTAGALGIVSKNRTAEQSVPADTTREYRDGVIGERPNGGAGGKGRDGADMAK